jgi:hypothetical protein
MAIIQTEYVLAKKRLQRSKLTLPSYYYLKASGWMETIDQGQAFRTTSLSEARTRLAAIQQGGDGEGFNVMRLEQKMTIVR